jgi:uncharacterized Ntn-hydrolase superfamily protein
MTPQFNTFSIVAYDPAEKAWGIAVASKFLAAGAVVSWARAGAGAVATQALAKVSFGPDGLDLMARGKSAQETLDALLARDKDASHRQVGMVDANGGAAAHTGTDCLHWAGHRIGDGFTCQGNILTGPETLDAMAGAFTSTNGELADRLLAALLAGDMIGGDSRGKQSAAVTVVRPNGGYGGDNDRYLDLRVDDDPEPVQRLAGLVAAHHIFFGDSDGADNVPITGDVARDLKRMLRAGGYISGAIDDVWDAAAIQAFWKLVGNENLEERWHIDGDTGLVDRVALDYLRSRFPA